MSLWISLYQTSTPHCGCAECKGHQETEVFDQNITHNLGNMAEAAGLYMPIWCPEEVGINRAEDLLPLLQSGIDKMEKDPEAFKEHDAPNGWGTYEDFLPWLIKLRDACEEYPLAKISISK